MNRRIQMLAIGSLLLPLGCGGDDPAASPTPAVSIAVVIGVGEDHFSATATLSDGTTEDVTSAAAWTSSDTSMLTVSAAGRFRVRSVGRSEVCATYQGVSGCTVLTMVP